MSETRRRVLVVEDDPELLRIMTLTLDDAGYNVVTAMGGDDAMGKLAAERFDLILTDLAMPRTTGVDVIRKVRRDPKTWRIPVVAVTAHWLGKISEAATEAGCDGFIAKPFSKEELLYEVAKYLQLSHDPLR